MKEKLAVALAVFVMVFAFTLTAITDSIVWVLELWETQKGRGQHDPRR